MSQTSTMFLTSVTCIDHAYIDQNGHVIGGSFSPDFFVSGEVEQHEQVVIDFSKCKKQIKAAIDSNEDGYDHKLWIIPGFSNCEWKTENGRVYITTPALDIEGPEDMAKVFTVGRSYDETCFELESFLESKISGVDFGIHLDPSKQYTSPCNMAPSFFRYSHGLKNSSSYGCKNIAHGHLSYIAIQSDHVNSFELQQKIASVLNKTMFVFDENFKNNVIEYKSERGHFKVLIKSSVVNPQRICILNTETTIENIVEAVYNMFSDELHDIGATSLYISEGVHKGACKLL